MPGLSAPLPPVAPAWLAELLGDGVVVWGPEELAQLPGLPAPVPGGGGEGWVAAHRRTALNRQRRRPSLHQPHGEQLWAGVDEAGRGPLAGPLVACAVVAGRLGLELDDSKKLSPSQRQRLWVHVLASCRDVRVAICPPALVDAMNVQRACLHTMARAVQALREPYRCLWVDGPFPLPLPASTRQRAVVGADGRVACVAAASIVAKVVRDTIMAALDLCFPGYGFARHKGYPTPEHVRQLARLGPSPIHRRSFRWGSESGRREAAMQ